jgi:hypothetical protein
LKKEKTFVIHRSKPEGNAIITHPDNSTAGTQFNAKTVLRITEFHRTDIAFLLLKSAFHIHPAQTEITDRVVYIFFSIEIKMYIPLEIHPSILPGTLTIHLTAFYGKNSQSL